MSNTQNELDEERVKDYLYRLVVDDPAGSAYLHYRWLLEPDGLEWTPEQLEIWAANLARRLNYKFDKKASYKRGDT